MKLKLGILGVLIATITTLWACNKDVTVMPTAADEAKAISAFVAANAGFEKLPSGLYFKKNLTTTNAAVSAGKTVNVHYVGRFLNGNEFDSSIKRGKVLTFVAGARDVVAGFDEAVLRMKVGEKASALLPSALGYGPRGVNGIPGYTPLLFDIEIVSIQ